MEALNQGPRKQEPMTTTTHNFRETCICCWSPPQRPHDGQMAPLPPTLHPQRNPQNLAIFAVSQTRVFDYAWIPCTYVVHQPHS